MEYFTVNLVTYGWLRLSCQTLYVPEGCSGGKDACQHKAHQNSRFLTPEWYSLLQFSSKISVFMDTRKQTKCLIECTLLLTHCLCQPKFIFGAQACKQTHHWVPSAKLTSAVDSGFKQTLHSMSWFLNLSFHEHNTPGVCFHLPPIFHLPIIVQLSQLKRRTAHFEKWQTLTKINRKKVFTFCAQAA